MGELNTLKIQQIFDLLKLNSFEFDEHSHAFLQGKSCDQPTEINDECALLVIYTSDHP